MYRPDSAPWLVTQSVQCTTGIPLSSTIPSTIYHLTSVGSRPVSHIGSDRRLPLKFIMHLHSHPKTPNPSSTLYPITNTWEEHPPENPHNKHSQTLDNTVKNQPRWFNYTIFKLTVDTFYKGDQYCFMCFGNSLKTLKHTMPMDIISCLDWKQGNRRWVGWRNNSFYIDTFIADFQAKKKSLQKAYAVWRPYIHKRLLDLQI